MIFSDALPVQFWQTGYETFNEKEVDGVFNRCFCQPFNSSDEITTQFKDTSGYLRRLIVVDDNNEYRYTAAFTEASTGLYQKSFTPEDQGIFDDLIQLKIADTTTEILLIAPDLWTADSGTFDNRTSTSFIEAVTSADNLITAYQSMVIPTGTTVAFTVEINQSNGPFIASGSESITVSFYATDGAGTIVSNVSSNIITEFVAGSENPIIFTPVIITTSAAARLYIRITENLIGENLDLSIEIPVGQVIYISPTAFIANSDCISIKEDHDETVLINYHNNRIFASLNSSIGTPDPEFNLRIPAIFSESDDRYPRESEGIDLSNNQSLQLMAEIKKQRLLKIKHMPSYMHRKTVLALSFQTVTIDGLTWKLDEAYEKAPGNPRFPLKTAQVYLTDRNYTLRNVL